VTSLFDGMAGLLTDVFGGPVTITPVGGAPQAVRGVFREVPIDDDVADGRPGFSFVPVLRLQKLLSDSLTKHARVTLPDGREFILLRPVPGGSPAADAFVTWEMEAVR
jgi:hypothetical protein